MDNDENPDELRTRAERPDVRYHHWQELKMTGQALQIMLDRLVSDLGTIANTLRELSR